ncbi:hypothetical protein [Corynebacterium lowii]|uniref:Uncharacterized protein n=1 Tax=Corynebacterium lowii TaxID=1544413 RepID=A0A0Q0ZB90_9CORY|nr:hypothetical protein [Corynebacterium lowii]KQB87255.1 hypothetical protein Clow_00310 [Corynebacterium lowii]MDP9852158.1 hypothetical protein [Corynebacterium lowii]
MTSPPLIALCASIEEVNELAREYLLSPRERELWERIDHLTWLIKSR